jgi:DNA-binding GntR family transcriptional regulator
MVTSSRTAMVVMGGQPYWIREEQLDGWHRIAALWLSRRERDAFDRWFEWSFHSMVVDLCDNPLRQEEI